MTTSVDNAATGRRASPRAVLVAATASQASASAINIGLPSIGPDLRAEFGLGLAELGAVLTAGLLGSGLALIAAGIAVDRFGTRVSMLSAVALAIGGLLEAAFADSREALFVGLLVFGIGTAVVPVAGAGELMRSYPVERRGWALGIRQMSVPLGGILAAVALPGLVALGGIRLALVVGAVLVGASGLVFGLVAGAPRPPVARGTEWSAFRTIVSAPGMLRLFAVAALYIVVLQALLAFAVPAGRDAGLSAFEAGAAYVVVNVAAVAARVIWGVVADGGAGTRRARTLVETGLVAALGAVLFGAALHAGAAAVFVAAALFGFGALGWNGVLYLTATERVGMQYAARAMGVASTVVFVLSFAVSPLVGSLAAHAGWDAVWFGASGVALAGALVAAALARTGPAATTTGASDAAPGAGARVR